jgi:hypothetical protein
MDVETDPDLRRWVRVGSSTTIVLKVTRITAMLVRGVSWLLIHHEATRTSPNTRGEPQRGQTPPQSGQAATTRDRFVAAS